MGYSLAELRLRYEASWEQVIYEANRRDSTDVVLYSGTSESYVLIRYLSANDGSGTYVVKTYPAGAAYKVFEILNENT